MFAAQRRGRMLLEARELTAILAGETGDVRVLDELSFALGEGEIVDIAGPSGSGKSTLLRALARLLPRCSGEISLLGRLQDSMRPQEWRVKVTLLPQKPAIVAGCIRDNLLLPWTLKARSGQIPPAEKDMRAALDMLGLGDVGLERDAARLSVGQQARLAFARVWLTRPVVLLLDEADAALDTDSATAMRAALARFVSAGEVGVAGATGIVRVRHRDDDGLAHRRLRLADGRLHEVER